MTGAAEAYDPPQLVPRLPPRRDRALPIIIAASTLLHVTVLLPLLARGQSTPLPPREIPVELVQLPLKPPEKAVPAPAPKPAQKPPPAEKAIEPPRQAARKPPPVRQAARKPPPPKAVAQRPPPKPAETVADRFKELIGPMPAFALPGEAEAGTESVSYSQLVLSQVAKAKKVGRYRGMPGAAGVAFSLGDRGEVASVEIVRPSGDAILDAEAIAMVRRGAPYPPPPQGGRRDYAITLRFSAI